MIATTVNSTACFLITEDPNWSEGVKGTFSLLTSNTEAKTRRQERHALSATIRTLLEWTASLDYTDAATFRSSLHSLGLSSGSNVPLQPILCPFWPAAAPYSSYYPPKYSAQWAIVYEPDWSNWMVYDYYYTGPTGYSVTPLTMWAPILWGTFPNQKLPKVIAETDEETTVQFQFLENGNALVALNVSATVPTGPGWQGASSWPIFPNVPDFSKTEAGEVDVIIDRKQIGYTRDEQQTVYPQTPPRVVKSGFTLTDGTDLLSLWAACSGDVSPFWIPAEFSPCQLTADITSGNVINVDNAAALDGQDHIFLNGATWAAQQISSETGNIITLAAAPGVFYAAQTVVQPLLFAHFVGPTVSIEWTDQFNSTAEITVQELPPEYGSPSGETFGQTIGPLGWRAYLYAFTDTIGSWYYTSNERAINYGGQTYQPITGGITHDTITERINLSDSDTTITLRYFSGNPFSKYRAPRLQMTMFCTITQLDAPSPSDLYAGTGVTAQVILTGRMKQVKADDAIMQVIMGGPTSIFDQYLPRPLVQLLCNNTLFDENCTLSRANWTFTATMATPPSPGPPFQYTISSLSWPQGALPTIGADYFAFGYITRTLSDGTKQGSIILASTALSGGAVTLSLSGDLDPFPTGSETWTAVLNCAGRYNEDCISTFNNKANFSGMPFMPLTDPSILPITDVTTATSKK